jgi:tRNA 2-thiouridine synthesizing protein A
MPTVLSDAEITGLGDTIVVDARGVACPGPMLEAKKAMGKVPVGGVMELLSGDSQTKEDMGFWTEMAGHTFLGVIPARGYDRLFIRRGK